MKRTLLWSAALLGLLVSWVPASRGAPDYYVIVNAGNPVTSLTKEEVSQLLLKKVTRWEESGVATAPVDLESDSELRETFSRDIHGRSVASIKNYWQRQIFSGREVPPPELKTDAEVVEFVRSNEGAIGYVSAGVSLDGVKRLIVTE